MWPTLPWAMSQKRKRKRQERRKKRVKKDLIHSHRCVTLLLPQQKFTTELMTKGQAPCSLLWPGEQYEGLWMANPSGPLTGWAFKQPGDSFLHRAGPLSDRGGKTWAAYCDWAFAQSRDWEIIVKGKYYLYCRAVAVFVMSEDELGENMPPEGDWNGDSTVPDCVNAFQPFSVLNCVSITILLTSFMFRKWFALRLYFFSF